LLLGKLLLASPWPHSYHHAEEVPILTSPTPMGHKQQMARLMASAIMAVPDQRAYGFLCRRPRPHEDAPALKPADVKYGGVLLVGQSIELWGLVTCSSAALDQRGSEFEDYRLGCGASMTATPRST